MATAKPAKKIFPIKTFISDLPTTHILQTPPSASESEARPARGRLVIIGDIHGMRKSLSSLLDKVTFDQHNGDHLILVGDLVNKGPDSAGVVDIAMKLGASAVRGNHENAVLHAAEQIRAKRESLLHAGILSIAERDSDSDANTKTGQATPAPAQTPSSGPDFELVGDMENFQKYMAANAGPDDVLHGAATYTTALKLSKRHLEWLASLPLILRVELPRDLISPFGENLIVVHAGLVPNVSLEKQEPHSIMHMRSLNRASSEGAAAAELLPTEDFGEEGWIKEWDSWQESQEVKTTVVFGHDAKRRLQVGKYTIGLDSACLYGYQLSALVISTGEGRVQHRVVQVDCVDEPVVPPVPVPVPQAGTEKETTQTETQ
jgi:diadenosine tetraphosphatase ApaH/serine/threonine PP2A family protein phosphatase